MTVREMLVEVAGGPRREQAARGLLEWLTHVADRRLKWLTQAEREDAVQSVLVKVLTGRVKLDRSEQELQGYVATCLTNLGNDAARARKRQKIDPGAALAGLPDRSSAPLDASEPEPAPLEELAATAHEKLSRPLEQAVADRAERYRAALRTAWKQIWELRFERLSMDVILVRDEGIGADASAGQREKAAARVYAAHTRARQEIRAAIAKLEATGILTAEDARQTQELVALLFRSQKRAARASR